MNDARWIGSTALTTQLPHTDCFEELIDVDISLCADLRVKTGHLDSILLSILNRIETQ
jgi:hypothetical protein